ncbi:Rieske 2Fe-2S domain-containing protein [Streptomyces sp. NPDC056716]|uniref:Rieske 2Fe-2S domain-containing protein n=1 Tax=unclassified Streptomyces TaxID=2593676 RepID=UPI00367A0578
MKSRPPVYRGIPGASAADAFPPRLPHPIGWYCPAFSQEIRRGQILTRQLADEDIVLYRTRKGTVRATRPYCPHLGAHLGGGKVKGEELICPFHHFAFNTDGTCTATPYYGQQVPKLSAPMMPVREQAGLIMVWYHPDGTPPDWEVPPLPDHRTHKPVLREMSFGGYPQDLPENALDYGHAPSLHNFTAERVEEKDLGPIHELRLLLRKTIAGRALPPMPIYLTQYGLGILRTEADLTALGFNILIWTCPVPTKGARMTLRAAVTTRVGQRDSAPRRALGRLVSYAFMRFVIVTIRQDAGVWNHRRYTAPPHLAQGDGPIGPARRWAEKFYPKQPQTAPQPEDLP